MGSAPPKLGSFAATGFSYLAKDSSEKGDQ